MAFSPVVEYYLVSHMLDRFASTMLLQYDPAIIERTIGLVLGPFTALCRSFLKRCTLTNKAVGTI